jgi:site-specific DNA recombinase
MKTVDIAFRRCQLISPSGTQTYQAIADALIQNRKAEAGSVARIPAPEIEALVFEGVRKHLAATTEPSTLTDRDLIERHVVRVIVTPQAVEVHLLAPDQTAPSEKGNRDYDRPSASTITLPWSAPSFSAVKRIVHAPSVAPAIKPEARDALLTAIAKARRWVEDIRLGRVASLAAIADRESQGARYIRMLVPLAFLSPRIIAAIVEGKAAPNLTVSALVRALPHSWVEERSQTDHSQPASQLERLASFDQGSPRGIYYMGGV